MALVIPSGVRESLTVRPVGPRTAPRAAVLAAPHPGVRRPPAPGSPRIRQHPCRSPPAWGSGPVGWRERSQLVSARTAPVTTCTKPRLRCSDRYLKHALAFEGLHRHAAGTRDGVVHLFSAPDRDVQIHNLVSHILRGKDVLDPPLLGLRADARVRAGREQDGGLLAALGARSPRRRTDEMIRQAGASRRRPILLLVLDFCPTLRLVHFVVSQRMVADHANGFEFIPRDLPAAGHVHLLHGHVEHGAGDPDAQHAHGLLDLIPVELAVVRPLAVQHVEDHPEVSRGRRIEGEIGDVQELPHRLALQRPGDCQHAPQEALQLHRAVLEKLRLKL
eukprot:scaffold2326_cov286-Pinguiococcus_pyrenoidosus.AAC.5